VTLVAVFDSRNTFGIATTVGLIVYFKATGAEVMIAALLALGTPICAVMAFW